MIFMKSAVSLLSSSLASHPASFRSLCSRLVMLCSLVFGVMSCNRPPEKLQFFPSHHLGIQYIGRLNFSDSTKPVFWQPGVQVNFTFSGDSCGIILQDEQLWGTSHNYIQLVVDSLEKRIRLVNAIDTIWLRGKTGTTTHQVSIIKNTEANIGYIAVKGVIARELLAPPALKQRKIEFIGNSITCGMGSDTSDIPCGKGQWYDQHNAAKSYGALTATALNARYHLSSVSGIGLMHSCCGMKITMPQVFNKISMHNDSLPWNFALYQPDLVSICLGQNDGVQDSVVFVNNYIRFLKQLRTYYPKAQFICITSPMADDQLRTFLKNALAAVVLQLHQDGDQLVDRFIFENQYTAGCDFHPSLSEHRLIAEQLTAFIRQKMKW